MKVRKFLINAFVREAMLYDDEIVITYNFTDNPENLKVKKDQVQQEEKQISRAKSALYLDESSRLLAFSPPVTT